MESITVSNAGGGGGSQATSQSSRRRSRSPDPQTAQHNDSSSSPRQPKRRRVADGARMRAVRACLRCRRLKEKCDSQHPCERCIRSGRTCEYTPVGGTGEGRSGTSSNAPFSVSASSSGDVVAAGGAVQTEERTKCLEKLVQHLLGDVPMDLNNLRRMSDKIGSRPISGTGPGSEVNGAARVETEDVDDLTLEDENFTVKTLSQSTAHYSGEFSHWNFSQKLRRRLSQCLETDVPIISRPDARGSVSTSHQSVPISRGGPMRILEYWRATQLQSPKSLVQSVLSCLPPRNVAKFLVQVYFQFAQVNCFYAEEGWLRKKLEFLYEAPGHVTSEDAAWVSSVLMVLAIGTQFAHMAAHRPESENDEPDAMKEPSMEQDVGVTFYQMASKLIPDIITIASMESVQACLLLAHYALPLDTAGLAYTYLGLGIKMAIQNGMHRKYSGTDLDAWTVETRNRLWWTAYTVERRVSVLHGRPASISLTELDAEIPKDLPEFRQTKAAGHSKFASMSLFIDMNLRLGDIANAITLLRRCPKNLQPTYFERTVDVFQNLRTWWSSLPPEVHTPTPESPLYRSHAHLKLSYHLIAIFVGRPFIFYQTSGSTPVATSSPPSSTSNTATDQGRPKTRAALVERAVEAAIDTINLLHQLHQTTGLARSSYTEFSSCRAALLVMLAQSVNARSDRLSTTIDLGMQLIRRMTVGNNVSTRSETSIIEALETAVRRLHEQTQSGDGGFSGDGKSVVNEKDEDAGKSGYERFREWASLWPMNGEGRAGAQDAEAFGRSNGLLGVQTPPQLQGLGAGGNAWTPLVGQTPDSARWITGMNDGIGDGLSLEQLDDAGLFGRFPELGALEGWSGLI